MKCASFFFCAVPAILLSCSLLQIPSSFTHPCSTSYIFSQNPLLLRTHISHISNPGQQGPSTYGNLDTVIGEDEGRVGASELSSRHGGRRGSWTRDWGKSWTGGMGMERNQKKKRKRKDKRLWRLQTQCGGWSSLCDPVETLSPKP